MLCRSSVACRSCAGIIIGISAGLDSAANPFEIVRKRSCIAPDCIGRSPEAAFSSAADTNSKEGGDQGLRLIGERLGICARFRSLMNREAISATIAPASGQS